MPQTLNEFLDEIEKLDYGPLYEGEAGLDDVGRIEEKTIKAVKIIRAMLFSLERYQSWHRDNHGFTSDPCIDRINKILNNEEGEK
jgi:hypothetical protein